MIDDGTVFVPRALFDHLVAPTKNSLGPILFPETYSQLQVVAVRFDLCDRAAPGACPEMEDGRLRLVFQPVIDERGAPDIGFHAFYRIGNAEIPEAIAALRDLAKSSPVPQNGALRTSPALTSPLSNAYAAKLRALLRRYGGETRLVRLTINAQPETTAAIRWTFRGVERRGGAFVDMNMVGSSVVDSAVLLTGSPDSPGYEVTPSVDQPSGLAAALTTSTFEAASDAKKRDYLSALVAVENPMTHSAETAACIGCHASTAIMSVRANRIGLDPSLLTGRYTSKFDLSVAGGKSRENAGTLRALGYFGKQPMISQRVVNDTAQTLAEIEHRYPPR